MPPTAMRRRHDRLSIAFHWATLAILLLGFASIESRALFEPGSAMRMRIMEWHYLLGLLVLMMTLARLYHRVTRGRVPAITPALPAWADILSHAMHYALYATLLALPVLGLLTVSLQGDPLHLGFGLALPPVTTADAARAAWLEGLHALLGDTLYVLIGLHALTAIAHHYILHDNALQGILPPRFRPGRPGRRPGAPRPPAPYSRESRSVSSA